MNVDVTVLGDHVFRSERNCVLDILVVGDRRAGNDLGVGKIALDRRPTNRPLEFIDCVLALGVDDNFKSFNTLDGDWIVHLTNRELDNPGLFAWARRDVVFRQEFLNAERLLVSEALLSDGAIRPSQNDIFNLALQGLDFDLLRELNVNHWVVFDVDCVVRSQLKHNHRALLDHLDDSIGVHLNRAALGGECHLLVDHCDVLVLCIGNEDLKRVCCLLVVGLLKTLDVDGGDLVVVDVLFAGADQGQGALRRDHP